MRYLEPTLYSVATAILRHWLVVASAVLLVLTVSVVAYLKTAPTYEASTSLLVGQTDRLEGARSGAVPTEFMNSQTQIAASDDVLRAAIGHVGLDRLAPDEPGPFAGIGGKFRAFVKGALGAGGGYRRARRAASDLDLAIARAREKMVVRAEPNSNIMTIGFRAGDAAVAADMSNALARSYIDQQGTLLERPGLIDFLRAQTSRFDEEVARSSIALEEFMNHEQVYSIDEQRSLLLHRASDSNAALSETRGSLAEKEGQKLALARQLALLGPIARSPFASGFVEKLDSESGEGGAPDLTSPLPLRADDTPPLLMIKVFQDAMASYRILDSEVGGLRRLEAQRETEREAVNVELARVTALQSTYERLRRDVELTTFNAETFAKRTVQEQIESDLRDAKLSSMQVIQPATVPRRAVSPKGVVYVGFGLALGIVAGVALALAKATADLNRREPGFRQA